MSETTTDKDKASTNAAAGRDELDEQLAKQLVEHAKAQGNTIR